MGSTHRLVRTMSPEWTVLRPSWFMQNFTNPEHPLHQEIAEHGTITTATGDGRIGFVDAEDIAEVAAHALLDPVPHDTDHVITGPATLNYAEAAELLSTPDRPIRHIAITVAEQENRLASFGYPPELCTLLASLENSIAQGTDDRVTDVVHRITSHSPHPFTTFLAR